MIFFYNIFTLSISLNIFLVFLRRKLAVELHKDRKTFQDEKIAQIYFYPIYHHFLQFFLKTFYVLLHETWKGGGRVLSIFEKKAWIL